MSADKYRLTGTYDCEDFPDVTCGTAGVGAGQSCVFPFIDEGVTYYDCTYKGGYDEPWCSTQTSGGWHVSGQWGFCLCPTDTTTMVTRGLKTSTLTSEPPHLPRAREPWRALIWAIFEVKWACSPTSPPYKMLAPASKQKHLH